MPVFIYTLCDPDTEIVRYIGRSLRPEKRYGDHLRDKTRTHRGVWVRSLLAQGKKPLLRLLEETTQGAKRREYLGQPVSCYRHRSTNLTGGGDGACTDDRMHLSTIKRGQPLTEAHRAALRRAWGSVPTGRISRNATEALTGNGATAV